MDLLEIVKISSIVGALYIVWKIIQLLTGRPTHPGHPQMTEALSKQTVILERQELILADVRAINLRNGEKLDEISRNLAIAMTRQLTIKDFPLIKP